MGKHLIWINPLALPWRLGLLVAVVLLVVAVIAGMATTALPTWLGIVLLLAIAVLVTFIHRIGTFLIVDDDVLRFGRYPHPQDEVPLSRIKSARVEELPQSERTSRPWGTSGSVVDVNGSSHAIALSLLDGRTIKVGVGPHRPSAEDFVANLREQHRSIRG